MPNPTFLATEGLRSPLRRVAAGGRVVITYMPYGGISTEHAEPQIGFTGQVREPMLSGYMLGNGYRLYNPDLMRFLSPDQLSPFEMGGLNSYSYCLGDPINRHDPTGHFTWAQAWSMFSTIFTNAVNILGASQTLGSAMITKLSDYYSGRQTLSLRDPYVAGSIIGSGVATAGAVSEAFGMPGAGVITAAGNAINIGSGYTANTVNLLSSQVELSKRRNAFNAARRQSLRGRADSLEVNFNMASPPAQYTAVNLGGAFFPVSPTQVEAGTSQSLIGQDLAGENRRLREALRAAQDENQWLRGLINNTTTVGNRLATVRPR